MTNYIKKLLAAITVAGAVMVTPVAAQECTFKLDEYRVQIEQMNKEGTTKLEIIAITPSQLKNFTDKAGDPPGVDASKPHEAHLVKASSGSAMLLIVQENCVVTTAGPLPLEAFLKAFGLVDASVQ